MAGFQFTLDQESAWIGNIQGCAKVRVEVWESLMDATMEEDFEQLLSFLNEELYL